MPLVRLELRNEYALGNAELYSGAARREDPKAVLDGVAAAGLVGILRQLGDLAGFAAEVFHDLHEQITSTSVRAQRMSSRIQHIESSLPSIEEAVRSQASHIHFAYLPGSDWHANIQLEHDHLLCSDLPHFIMDCYEECRDPPRLFLLDKFDGAGAGACLKRYSDPTYFKRVWTNAQMAEVDKSLKEKKTEKRKIKGLEMRNAELHHIISLSRRNNSIQFTSSETDEQSTAAETVCDSDARLKDDLDSRSTSFDSRARHSCVEPVLSMHSSLAPSEGADNMPTLSMLHINDDGGCSSIMSNNCAPSSPFPESLQYQEPGSPARLFEETKIPEPTKTKLSEAVSVGKVQEVEYQPGNIGIHKHSRDDLKLEEPTEDILFDMQNASFNGGMLSKQDDQKSENDVLKKNILDNEFDVSPEVASTKQASENYQTELLTENNSVNDRSCQEELSFELENKESVVGLCECVPAHTKESLILGLVSSPFQTNGEETDDIANTSNGQVTLFKSANGERKLPSVHKYFEEVPSETENYMDALNTMDSETESEAEFRNTQEPGISSIFNHSRGITLRGEHKLPTTLNSCNDDNDVLPESFPSTVFSDDTSLQNLSTESLHTDPTPQERCCSNGSCKSCQSKKSEKLGPDASYDLLPRNTVFHSEAIFNDVNDVSKPSLCNDCNHLEVHEASDDPPIPPVKIWTNACLFGVEPSKPQDTSVQLNINPNSAPIVHEDHLMEQLVPSNLQCEESSEQKKYIFKPNDNNLERSLLEEKVGSSSSLSSHTCTLPSDGTDISNKMKQQVDIVDFLASDNCKVKSDYPMKSVQDCSKLDAYDISESQNAHSVLDTAVASLDSKASPSLCNEIHEKPMFNSNNLQSTSAACAESLPPISKKFQEEICLQKTDVQIDNESTTKREFEAESSFKQSSSRPHLSPTFPSSPPLKNMKISFHPINEVANSKLKLEFSGRDIDEGIENLMFPSFQLLSGPSSSQQYISSESDDDTFCRSSPYNSENVFSPKSETGSDSELWESDEESTFEGMKLEDIIPAFQSSHVLDIPGLDSIKENNCPPKLNSLSDVVLSSLVEQPPPPPLPPLQWRIVKTSLPSMEITPISNDGFSMKLDNLQVQMPEGAAPLSIIGKVKTVHRSKSMMEGHKSLGYMRGKSMGVNDSERTDDVLYQLRKRSMSLRRMEGKPTFMPEAPTNVKVAAILEKANAIRQAHVRTGEGEDDNWSDG